MGCYDGTYAGGMNIAAFLAARLDEDDRAAAVKDGSAPWNGQWQPDGTSAVRTFNGHVLVYARDGGDLKPGLAEHIARHDPARVRREIAAKRRRLRRHYPVPAGDIEFIFCGGCPSVTAWPCPELRDDASAYIDHPDYNHTWSVGT